MDILLTYQTALQAIRLEEYPALAREWDERTGLVPERIPRMADVRRMLAECPTLGRLSLPLQLLVSSDATSHSCELFSRRISHDIYPGHAFVRIDREVLVVSPELLPMQFCLHVPRLEGALRRGRPFCRDTDARPSALARGPLPRTGGPPPRAAAAH